MDLDVAWCLTCSKSTDSRSPYCSVACRERDRDSNLPTEPKMLMSPMPPPMIEVSRRLSTASQQASRVVTPTRSSIAPDTLRPPPVPFNAVVSDLLIEEHARMGGRDRRAYSFPAAQSPLVSPGHQGTPTSIKRRRESRQSSGQLPPFARRPMGPSSCSTATAIQERSVSTLRPPRPFRHSVSTGENTPLDPESVFCSTSESEDELGIAMPCGLLGVRMSTPATSTLPPSMPLSRKSSSKSGSPANARALSKALPTVNSLTSESLDRRTLASFGALSSSLRSLEIMSWARAVDSRADGESSDDEDRGRSRTRRVSPDVAFTPIPDTGLYSATEPQLGSTPPIKGTFGSALAGLGKGLGVAPIVKALTASIPSLQTVVPAPTTTENASATIKLNNAKANLTAAPSPVSVLGLQSVPAPAEVSNVAVMTTSTAGNLQDYDMSAPPFQQYGGGTPTLSTISYSEAIDYSVNDFNDTVDIANSDDAVSTSSFARKISASEMKQQAAAAAPQVKQPTPTRRESRHGSLWNLTSYLRSFAPFTSSGPLHDPLETVEEVSPLQPKPYVSSISLPMPLARRDDDDDNDDNKSSPLDIVRSIPMDIVMPATVAGQAAKEERERGRDARITFARSRSRSRSSRSLSRRRKSRMRRSSGSSSSGDRDCGRDQDYDHAPVPQHVYQTLYDADASNGDDEPRGRSRRGKALSRDRGGGVRSMSRHLSMEDGVNLGDRSTSRGRTGVVR